MKIKQISKIKIYISVFLGILILSVIGVIVFNIILTHRSEEVSESYDKYYVMIPADSKLDFWQSVYEGAKEYAAQNGIFVELMGENLIEEYSKTDLMKIAIASRADGIIVCGDESAEMQSLINRAVVEGIPVVTVLNDSPQSRRCCYVSVGGYSLGREYGKQVLNIAGLKYTQSPVVPEGATEPIDVVAIVNSYNDNSDQVIVYSGIQDVITNETDDNSQINLSIVYVDDRNTFSTEESIRDIFRGENLPDIIVCLNETNTACVYQAVIDSNHVGDVSILGYYDSPTILKGIERETIYATASVDTNQMGMYCVKALDEFLSAGYTSQYLSADVTIIDQSNVEEYISENSGEESDD